MANKVSISNLGLAKIGAAPIQSFDDKTKEARTVKALYDFVFEATLRDHHWGFARKETNLALTTETFCGWDYAYAYPSDCLDARHILNQSDRKDKTIEYEISTSQDLSSKFILTNEEKAVLIYTARVENAVLYDTLFIDAFSFRLGSEFAIPIKGKPELQRALFQQYVSMINNAKASSSNEDNQKPDDSSAFSRARG